MAPLRRDNTFSACAAARIGRRGVSRVVTLLRQLCRKTPHQGRPEHCAHATHDGESGLPPAGLEGGQAIAEFAFAFPLQLFVMFAIIQLAMIYVASSADDVHD